MECETARPLLYRLIEDRLLASDESVLREHVDGCPDCALRFRQIAALDESAMEAETEQPSPSLRPKLLAAYRRAMADRRAKSSQWGRRLSAMRRAAVFALVAFGSGAATWVGVHQGDLLPAQPPRVVKASIGLDHVFPLQFRTPYTIQHEDGSTERGVRIQFVQ